MKERYSPLFWNSSNLFLFISSINFYKINFISSKLLYHFKRDEFQYGNKRNNFISKKVQVTFEEGYMSQQSRSQQLTSELNRIYGKLGSIISELNHQKVNGEMKRVQICLDLPADRRAHYSIKVRQNQEGGMNCQGCMHSVILQQRKEEEKKEEKKSYNDNDTLKKVEAMEEVTQQHSEAIVIQKQTCEEYIQTEKIEEDKQKKEMESIEIQTDQFKEKYVIQQRNQYLQVDQYPKNKNLQQLFDKSQSMTSFTKTKKKNVKEQEVERTEVLIAKIRKNFQRINELCSKNNNNTRNTEEGSCNCQGIFRNRSKRQLTPLTSNKSNKNLRKTFQYRTISSQKDRKITIKKVEDRKQKPLSEFIEQVKIKYSQRKVPNSMSSTGYSRERRDCGTRSSRSRQTLKNKTRKELDIPSSHQKPRISQKNSKAYS